ncbi:Lactonase, 7-bladed beta-propeller-domain-containing protein [Lipomyces tetrasporus]|uniref:Lactonase, 7-bladed beta-propeller-domain-containing protein n=1 Tax=Lipomyces tetrasporus TaxID=54092 RepID=A0AAD7QRS6_9ASCO|nr:Lactonase, 7-bladed beta-propeller-domain-containing protein [Lipomyces tetrasporus]KAJ8098597.1 Lactonase, 7-bladed beta-propeller-domain-containing protein [Lipomyces tetrasporus]
MNGFLVFLFFALSSLVVVYASPTVCTPESELSPHILYVALQSRGILTLSFDPSKSVQTSLEVLDTNTDAGFMPGWLTARGDKIYSISRTGFPTNAAANIDGSTVCIHPLSEGGIIGEASYLFKYTLSHPGPGTNGSQVQSNPHEAIFDPSGQYMFVNDRGADRIYVYNVDGPYNVTRISTVVLPPGTGPRHSTFRAFNSTRTYMYLASELDNTVRVFTLDGVHNDDHERKIKHYPPTLDISLRQTASTLGPGSYRTSPNDTFLASEIALSNDGKFAYVSNRATRTLSSDTLAIYSVHPNIGNDSAHLVYLGQNETYGKIPRHFSLSPDMETRYAAVANEVSQNLVILERDPATGFMTGIKGKISFGTFDTTQNLGPAAVIWEGRNADEGQ